MENVDAPKKPKGRGKNTAEHTPASRGVSKKKTVKPKANPFRRSDTGKLKLKGFQMRKRVETQTPKVTLLRERFELAQSRLGAVSAKLKLVDEELASRAAAKEKAEEKAAQEAAEDSVSSYLSEVSLDSEVEEEAFMGDQASIG